MKKLVYFFYCFLLISSARADGKNRNYFEMNLPSVGEKFYPRVLLEDQNNFTDKSRLGLWTIIELSGLPYTPNSWKEKGYIVKDISNINLKVGLTYGSERAQLISGVGYSSCKSYFGPLLGITLNGRSWYLQAIGLYATKLYRSHYSAEEEAVPRIYIRGFDPNSWYKIQLLYSLSNHLDMGIISERFYGTGIVSEYNLGSVKFKFMFGKELEFGQNMYQLGLMFKM